MKAINETTHKLGVALRNARLASHLSAADMSILLRIMPNELLMYERGIAEIPADILERVLVMGYKMINLRALERKYRFQRNIFRRLKQTVSEIP